MENLKVSVEELILINEKAQELSVSVLASPSLAMYRDHIELEILERRRQEFPELLSAIDYLRLGDLRKNVGPSLEKFKIYAGGYYEWVVLASGLYEKALERYLTPEEYKYALNSLKDEVGFAEVHEELDEQKKSAGASMEEFNKYEKVILEALEQGGGVSLSSAEILQLLKENGLAVSQGAGRYIARLLELGLVERERAGRFFTYRLAIPTTEITSKSASEIAAPQSVDAESMTLEQFVGASGINHRTVRRFLVVLEGLANSRNYITTKNGEIAKSILDSVPMAEVKDYLLGRAKGVFGERLAENNITFNADDPEDAEAIRIGSLTAILNFILDTEEEKISSQLIAEKLGEWTSDEVNENDPMVNMITEILKRLKQKDEQELDALFEDLLRVSNGRPITSKTRTRTRVGKKSVESVQEKTVIVKDRIVTVASNVGEVTGGVSSPQAPTLDTEERNADGTETESVPKLSSPKTRKRRQRRESEIIDMAQVKKIIERAQLNERALSAAVADVVRITWRDKSTDTEILASAIYKIMIISDINIYEFNGNQSLGLNVNEKLRKVFGDISGEKSVFENIRAVESNQSGTGIVPMGEEFFVALFNRLKVKSKANVLKHVAKRLADALYNEYIRQKRD